MFGGFALLLMEIRFEHRGVVLEDWRGWIPLACSGAMLLLISLGTWLWAKCGRKILLGCYALIFLLGVCGVIIHADGHFFERVNDLSSVWTQSIEDSANIKAHYPPLLAPLAFTGLGLIGFLFCLEKKD